LNATNNRFGSKPGTTTTRLSTWPSSTIDGPAHTERFADADAFRAWLVACERDLNSQHWKPQAGGPVLLPDGWPDKPLR
jgi:hypothetical protein